ncbi:MAG TPA: TIGR04438 family Trp-rich protein [Burkholderiaceae bacterium]|nr:TIGR04438 family Trp-rich protein [Burkholderiaceae bacterium]
MWLVWLGVVLLALRWLGLLGLDRVSLWWIALPFLAALFWFEVVERRFGFDRKKAFDEIDAAKKKRIQDALDQDRAARRYRRRF